MIIEKDKSEITAPEEETELLNTVNVIGEKDVAKALATLQEYKQAKASLEQKIVDNEQWYKSRHWNIINKMYSQGDREKTQRPQPTSSWLFSVIANKHADAMDNIPAPAILPREEGDKADADTLSEIVPVILERNQFEDVYSNAWYYKLKNGTAVYGVFWDSDAENGLGDITVKKIDILNLFWQSGITNIQDSRNIFIVNLVDNDIIKSAYPHIKEDYASNLDVKQYVLDDNIDTKDKSLVIDWYYKKKVGSKTVLHFAKIIGNNLVYASENDNTEVNGKKICDTGWYEHGLYPVVFDVLYPEESSPTGLGYVDICKSSQTYIDKLDQAVMENTLRVSKTRYFAKQDGAVNMNDFADLSKDIVAVNGSIDESQLKKIEQDKVDLSILNYIQYKVEELKETSGNRDVNQGGSSGGVTAAAAISALQEAGNKLSRDMINASYRAYAQIVSLCIELIRQFYDVSRTFRIEGQGAVMKYISYSNAKIAGQPMPLPNGTMGERKPIFDIKVSAQRKSPFSTLSQNELAKELYSAGFFNPDMANQALMALELMEFEGKEQIKQKILEQQQRVQMQQNLMAMLAGQVMPNSQPIPPQIDGSSTIPQANGIAGAVKNYATPYAEQMGKRAIASVGEAE